MNIWQDTVSRRWADRFWKRIHQHLGPIEYQTVSWRVGELEQDGTRHAAAMAAEGADVIVLAIRCNENLPEPLRRWMEGWVPGRNGQDGVLVSLLGVNAPSAGWLEQTRQYLRALARQGQLDLIIEECPDAEGTASPDPDGLSESVGHGNVHF